MRTLIFKWTGNNGSVSISCLLFSKQVLDCILSIFRSSLATKETDTEFEFEENQLRKMFRIWKKDPIFPIWGVAVSTVKWKFMKAR